MNSPNSDNSASQTSERCLYCGRTSAIVWVHGHGQCSFCGVNVDECCRGESSCGGFEDFSDGEGMGE